MPSKKLKVKRASEANNIINSTVLYFSMVDGGAGTFDLISIILICISIKIYRKRSKVNSIAEFICC